MNSWYIAMNLVRRSIGSRKGFMIGILLPTIIISAIVGVSGGSSSEAKVPIGYIDLDRSEFSKHIIEELERNPTYELSELESEEEAGDLVADEDMTTAFIIPEGFEAQLLAGVTPTMKQIRLSISEASVTLEMALNEAANTVADSVSAVKATKGVADLETVKQMLDAYRDHQIQGTTVEWDENAGEPASPVIGIMLLFLMILLNQSIGSIVEDRHNQTLSRMYAAPVYSGHIAFGNFIGSVILGTIQIVAIMIITRYAFGFDFGVSFLAQFLILECFIMAALGIASAVGGIVRSTDQLSVINNLVMVPTCMIGGCFWRIELMPDFMQKIANFVPQKWAIEAMTRVSQGDAISDIALQLGILVLFAAVLLGFGASVLRPSESKL